MATVSWSPPVCPALPLWLHHLNQRQEPFASLRFAAIDALCAPVTSAPARDILTVVVRTNGPLLSARRGIARATTVTAIARLTSYFQAIALAPLVPMVSPIPPGTRAWYHAHVYDASCMGADELVMSPVELDVDHDLACCGWRAPPVDPLAGGPQVFDGPPPPAPPNEDEPVSATDAPVDDGVLEGMVTAV